MFSAVLGLIPILILFGVSDATSLHMFFPRHRLVAVPGISLSWALLVSCLHRRAVRLVFCIGLVALWGIAFLSSPRLRDHAYTWKYALEFAQNNASIDGAVVLICSDFPEADYAPMPLDSAKTSIFFAPLSYYQLSVPVVPMPRSLNDEALRVGSRFLMQAEEKHERFLALGFIPSYPSLNWLGRIASGAYMIRNLGDFDGVKVIEFTPKSGPASQDR
jgi:hypothetical protein